MPPLYDNIADALLLTRDDDWHTLTLDIVGATNEGNEGTEPDVTTGISPGVWTKINMTFPGDASLSDWGTIKDDETR